MSRDNKRLEKYLDAWRRDLIDLTRRNRLLNLSVRGSVLEIREPGVEKLLERLGQPGLQGWRFHYPPPLEEEIKDDPNLLRALEVEDPDLTEDLQEDEILTNVRSAAALSSRLRTLASRAATEFVDRGLRVLYLAVGVLEWDDGDPKGLSSPLVLIPVHLDRTSPREPFRLVGVDEERVANPALAAKLENEFGITLPELDPDDVPGYLRAVRSAIGRRDWVVSPKIILATLSFAKETIYRDLLDNESDIKESSVIQAITIGGEARAELDFEPIPHDSERLDELFPPEALNSVLDADGTQRACIVAAKQGRSFVMDGPPGSGKSQTISNVIAELLGDGKTVLFVSEKIAALEVVKNRLDDAHLGEFVLELHSHKATRKTVARKLGDSVRARLESPPDHRIDEKRLREKRRALSRYAAVINEPRFLAPGVRTLHDAIGRYGQLAHLPSLIAPSGLGTSLTSDLYSSILDSARSLQRAWGPVIRGEDFLWRDLSQAALDTPQAQINARIDETLRLGEAVADDVAGFADRLRIPEPDTLEGVQRLSQLSNRLLERVEVPEEWWQLENLPSILEHVARLASETERARSIRLHFEQLGVDTDLIPVDQTSLRNAIAQVDGKYDSTTSLAQLQGAASASHAIAQASAELIECLQQSSELLGVTLGVPRASTAESILELIDLKDREHKPVRTWLDAERVRQVYAAIRVVQPLVDEWQATENQLTKHFNENMKGLDIEALYDSDSDVQPKLGRLGSRGRRNRKQLAACSKTGKISTDIVSLLPVLRSWRKLTVRLETANEGEIFEDYFAGPHTDVSAVREALNVAERALSLAGTSADTSRLAHVISIDALNRPEVSENRQRLQSALTSWKAATACPLPIDTVSETFSLVGVRDRYANFMEILSQVAEAMVPYCRNDDSTIEDATSVAALHAELRASEATVTAGDPGNLLAPYFKGLDTDWRQLERALNWTNDITHDLQGRPSAQTVAAIQDAEPSQALSDNLQAFLDSVARLLDLFNEEHRRHLRSILSGRVDEAIELLKLLRSTSGDIAEWREFNRAVEELRAAELGSAVDYLVTESVPAETVVDIIERTVLEGWIDELLLSHSETRNGRRQDRDAIVEQFRQLDGDLHLQAARRVINACNERRPSSSISGEFQVIEREAEKKTRHMPVRELLKKAGQAAVDLKPCFMMSPLSVSQFLPGEIRFDCVIFDEASQIKPADAVNAIYRGKQVIIAGDERQLPPTSFFDKSLGEEDVYDEEEVDDFESVLNIAKAGLTQLPLRWHYRSRHESLISFSNREYYNGELITYPGAIHDSNELGVHFEHVPDGVYARGSRKDNVIEARQVVERVIYHATHHPHLSLGVIAFSEAQASRISYELEAVRRDDRPELDDYFSGNALDGFFIKNIESVQGDERDIIIFSIGYGRDEYGKFTMNFGPVGNQGGERRLNVAVTRARQRVEVVSSVRAADFQDSTNPRVQSLKRYLDYAERGLAAFADDPTVRGEPESPFEQDVVNVIRQLGYEPQSQVGQAGYRIDIGVKHPNEPGRHAIGVECDGATYHSSRVARDRDRLRQEVLEGLGWTLHRIWSTSWFRDRSVEIEKLRTAIENAIQGDPRALQTNKRRQLPEPEVVEIEEEVAPWATEYTRLPIRGLAQVPHFNNPSSGSSIRRLLVQIVEVLEPVHLEQIEISVKEVQHFDTMSASRKKLVADGLKILVRDGDLTRDRFGFYWASDTPEVIVRSGDPDLPSTLRKAAHVSPDEIKLAMFWLAKDARSIEPDDLLRRTARLFGWRRVGPDVQSSLQRAFSELLDSCDLQDGNGGRLTTGEREVPTLG